MLGQIKKYKLIVLLVLLLFGVKLAINSLLLAENGDTYDFFKIAYFLQQFNLDYASKRMPFLPLLLTPFPSQYFVEVGRFWINIFYFLTVVFSYKYFYLLSDKSKFLKSKVFKVKFRNFYSLCFSLVIATNILIFENSFYILADTIFLFFNVLYLYSIKKYGLNKPIIIAVISALAFYTRPEGAILFVITGVLYCLKIISKTTLPDSKFTIFNFQFSKQTSINALLFVVLGLILIAPYFLRNYYYYDSFFYSGYLEDEAGFLFDSATIMLRFSNFLYAVGGIWLLPTLYILFRSWDNKKFGRCEVPTYREKLEVGSFKLIKNNFTPEILVFLLYSFTLFIWGPYPRLYTIPTFLTLTMVYYLLASISKIKVRWFDVASVVVLTCVSIMFYVYTVQFLDQTDYGYRKVGKALAIVLSLPMIGYFYLYTLSKISKKTLLILFTVTLVVINLFIFVDKFRITRYKYYTIKQATLFAIQPGVSLENNVYYSSGSGLETWYLKDFEQRYFYKGSTDSQTFINNAKQNNVKLYITTEEMGYKDNLSNISTEKVSGKVIKVFKSPFFPGETKVIELSK